MVVALGPGKFYGSSLPRPRIYTDVKLNEERIDPPLPVSAPFLSWASEAHWSMGGLSFKRHRLQGRIEGNINKLRSEKEKSIKNNIKNNKVLLTPPSITTDSPLPTPTQNPSADVSSTPEKQRDKPASPGSTRRKRVRRLGDEFDKEAAAMRGRINKPEVGENGLESKKSSLRTKRKKRIDDYPSPEAPTVIAPLSSPQNSRSAVDTDDNEHTGKTTKGSRGIPSQMSLSKKGKGVSVMSSKMLAATARITRSGKESPTCDQKFPKV